MIEERGKEGDGDRGRQREERDGERERGGREGEGRERGRGRREGDRERVNVQVNGCCPGSLVDQNFLPVSLTTPVACTVAVQPFSMICVPIPALMVCSRRERHKFRKVNGRALIKAWGDRAVRVRGRDLGWFRLVGWLVGRVGELGHAMAGLR